MGKRQNYTASFKTKSPSQKQLADLRARLEELTLERDFLKKVFAEMTSR